MRKAAGADTCRGPLNNQTKPASSDYAPSV
jgi:hypothetical protein